MFTIERCGQLEALSQAALVVDARGGIRWANALALTERERAPRSFADGAKQALRGDERHWNVQGISAPGLPRHALLIRKEVGPHGGLPDATRTWGLTPRELEVLALVTRGHSNRSIAALLECSERTVEVHVTRLLEKSGQETRSQLIASLWRLR